MLPALLALSIQMTPPGALAYPARAPCARGGWKKKGDLNAHLLVDRVWLIDIAFQLWRLLADRRICLRGPITAGAEDED